MRPHVVQWLETVLPGGAAAALAPTWFTCVGLAGIVSLLAMLAIARRHRVESAAVANIVLWCYVAAVTAGIAVPAAIDAAQQLLATGRAQLRWAGMTSFWGYLAGGAAVAAVCRAHGVPLRRFADLATAPLGIALMLARLGCFLAGCDYGKVTALPWAVRFPAHSPAWQDHVDAGLIATDRAASLPVHPTQLYEAALGLALAGIALAAARRRWARRGDGRVFVLAAALYAAGRLVIEDLRGDAGRGIYLGLSSGQIFSLLVLAAVATLWRLHRVRGPSAAAASTAAAAIVASAVLAVVTADAHAQPAPTQPAQQPTQPAQQPAPQPQPWQSPPPSQQRPWPQQSPPPSQPQQPRPQQSPPQPQQPWPQQSPPPSPQQPWPQQSPPQPQQPWPQQPQPWPPPPQQPQPWSPPPQQQQPWQQPPQQQPSPPPPQPGQLYVPGGSATRPPPYPPQNPRAQPDDPYDAGDTAGAAWTGRTAIQVAALVGAAAAFNRRRDQVPALAGGGLSFGFEIHRFGLWLDLDSLGNRDASHGTLLVSGGAIVPVSRRLSIGGRLGAGATLVNFDDPAFRDVVGVTTRFEAILDVQLAAAWVLCVRPLAIDVLSAADLGGPIATWQTRLGVAYRFDLDRRSAAPSRATAAASPGRAR